MFGHKVGKPPQLSGIAQQQHFADGRRAVCSGEIVERTLQFPGKIVEHRSHLFKDELGIFSPHGIAFEVFGFGEREFHAPDNRFCESGAPDRHAPLPDFQSIRDDQIGRINTG